MKFGPLHGKLNPKDLSVYGGDLLKLGVECGHRRAGLEYEIEAAAGNLIEMLSPHMQWCIAMLSIECCPDVPDTGRQVRERALVETFASLTNLDLDKEKDYQERLLRAATTRKRTTRRPVSVESTTSPRSQGDDS